MNSDEMFEQLTDRQKKCIPDVYFAMIPIEDLVSNQAYQRPLSDEHIKSALEEFDVYQINPVKVSKRDGTNFVFDGQHTIEIVAAASGSRKTPVWCMIFDELKYKDEAHIFADQQKHVKTLSPYEIYHAHIEAGDERQMLIDSIVRSFGLEVTRNPKPCGLVCVNTLEKIFSLYGQEILKRTLHIAVATWEGEKNSLSGTMLMGITRIVSAYGDSLKESVFKENVGSVSVKHIIRTAKETRPGALGYAIAMIQLYNGRSKKGLSTKKLFESRRLTSYRDETEDEGEEEE